jgi:hypothetical protein
MAELFSQVARAVAEEDTAGAFFAPWRLSSLAALGPADASKAAGEQALARVNKRCHRGYPTPCDVPATTTARSRTSASTAPATAGRRPSDSPG